MNSETLLIFFVAVVFLLSKNVYGFNGNRIVNGSTTPDGVFEFLPKLIILNQGYGLKKLITTSVCSSTIISKRHILTAAHCVNTAMEIYENSGTKWNYRASAIFIKHRNVKSGMGLNVLSLQTKYYFHPTYRTGDQWYGDIAIIELPETAKLDITPIKLASGYVEKEGDMAIAAGYGIYKWGYNPTTGELISESPQELQNATVPVHVENITDIIVTASHERFADSGDSGGPLLLERNGKLYQVGVTSMVYNFDIKSNVKNVYTRLSSFCDWISKVTKGEAKCEPLPAIDPNPPPQPAPINPPAPGPSQDETTTQAALNSNVTDAPAPQPNDKTDAPQPAPNPEHQNSKSNVTFTFNVFLLFLFIGFLVFA